MDARADRGADPGDSGPAIAERASRTCGDLLACPSPAGMDQRRHPAILGDERDRRTVGRGYRHPGVARAYEEAVRITGSQGGFDDSPAMYLPHAQRRLFRNAEGVTEPRTILQDGFAAVSDFESEVEGGIGALARASGPAWHSEPNAGREMARGRTPEGETVDVPGSRHAPKRAWFRVLAQAACASALVVMGCAGVPKLRTGEEAKARFLAAHAGPGGPVRGVGSVSMRRPGERRGGARARWASVDDSVALIGYVGPSRALDAALLGDSLYFGLRPWRIGVSGPVRGREGLDARLLHFVVKPWEFGRSWLRSEVERAAFEPSGEGWICRGAIPAADPAVGDSGSETPFRFALELSSKGALSRLTIRREGESREILAIRYGAERRFRAGWVPRWIEWSFSGTVIRLAIEDVAPVDPAKVRYAPAPSADWTTVGLDEPRGRSLVRRLLGLPEEGAGP